MILNTQLRQIQQSATVAVADRVRRLEASGKKIIPLQVGDPDFPTPEGIVETAVHALKNGQTHYGPSRGFIELRRAIASRIDNKAGLSEIYDPEDEILVTHGGVHAYYLALQSVLNPGDEVLVPDPSWATHNNMVRLLRGKVIPVPTFPENGFLPSLNAWEDALTERTKAIVVNYPSNPTGVVPPYEYLKTLMDFVNKRNLWVISDEVYDNIFYDEAPTSITQFQNVRDRIIYINSFSKTFAMTGWRVGYIAAPKNVVDNALKVSQNSITCVAPFIQKAAHFALTNEDVQKEVLEMRDAYARRRSLVLSIYSEYKNTQISITSPQGAFYFFLDLRKLNMPSTKMCEKILDEAGVGLVPGVAFGGQGEGFIRMSSAASDSDVEAGFRAIMDWSEKQ